MGKNRMVFCALAGALALTLAGCRETAPVDVYKRQAMEAAGVTPVEVPIRGGTDGARLSYMGLPCPNLCTGGVNFHGVHEYIPAQALTKMTEVRCV